MVIGDIDWATSATQVTYLYSLAISDQSVVSTIWRINYVLSLSYVSVCRQSTNENITEMCPVSGNRCPQQYPTHWHKAEEAIFLDLAWLQVLGLLALN